MTKTKDKKIVGTPGLTIPEFDPVEAGRVIAQETSILEIHIGTPGFKKSINSEHFMKVLGDLTEEQIADLSPTMKKAVEDFRAGKFAMENGEAEDKLDPSMIRVSQDLIDKKFIKAIGKHDKRFTNWIKAHTVPSPIKFQGAYLMRLNEAELIDDAVLEFDKERRELVNAFGERWEAVVADAKTKRGPFFDASDYPSFNSVRSSYGTEARWLSFNVPAALAEINKAIYQRESKKAQLFYADAAQEARDALRISFQGMTDHLLSQLGNAESGKPKRFMGNSVVKLQEFISMLLGGGDLTNDVELQEIAKKAKDILSGVDAATIRKEEGLRATLETAVAAIKSEASKMVTIGKRKFALGQDDEPAGPPEEEAAAAGYSPAGVESIEHMSGQSLAAAAQHIQKAGVGLSLD